MKAIATKSATMIVNMYSIARLEFDNKLSVQFLSNTGFHFIAINGMKPTQMYLIFYFIEIKRTNTKHKIQSSKTSTHAGKETLTIFFFAIQFFGTFTQFSFDFILFISLIIIIFINIRTMIGPLTSLPLYSLVY